MTSPQDNLWSLTHDPSRSARSAENRPLLSVDSLEWFIRLRWVFIAAALALLVIDGMAQPGYERPRQVFLTLALLAAANVAWWNLAQWLRRQAAKGTGDVPAGRRVLWFAHGQIAMDLLALTAMLRYTGGVDSPLAIIYVFHMALGSLLLPPGHALVQGLWAVILYASVALGELSGVLRPHYALFPVYGSLNLYLKPAFVGIALGAMACGVFGTLYFTGYLAECLRRRDRQLQETNAALEKSQTAIRDIQARRSRFMQTAAHRLKSPLATIQTLAALIRDEIVHDADARATCERIIRTCREGTDHVAELLTLARVQDADPRRHRRAQADVGAVVAELCERYRLVARGKRLEFTWAAPEGEDLHAWVDPRDLVDCVGNVIDNAIKYTPVPGRVAVRVERSAAASPQAPPWVVIHVDDTGMGFDADALEGVERNSPTVFDVYRRGNNALAAGIAGSGLGLAIVRVVVEQAGGEINVQSAPGAGTRFVLRFPAGSDNGPAIRDTRAIHVIGGNEAPTADFAPYLTDEVETVREPADEETHHAHC